MRITVCGSMTSIEKMKEVKNELKKFGHEVIIPIPSNDFDYNDFTIEDSASHKIKHDLIKDYFNEIKVSNAILVVNISKNGIENYIGANSFLEMGYAYSQNIKIFILNPIPEMPYLKAELTAMQPTVIHSNFNINLY